ncbi:uncharacterized protein G2W53_019285 [Senna tora]|uniref:Uncharacterized protein n=1 Tax=Senna tora TaxID=362788 RepID=A0A834TWR5_9FABA|nr:uncharacterized protein G2W53_019285 [Senna tora]
MAKAIALFSVPTPQHSQLYKRNSISRNSSPSLKLIAPSCSPSSTALVEEDAPSPSPPPDTQSSALDSQQIPQSGCKACGREEMEKGCNGEGRIQGGIATVPGFGWWPIKAYRPCPGFVASGGRYRRQGQSMDEVAFGRGPTPSSSRATTTSSDKQPREKKESPKKFKK